MCHVQLFLIMVRIFIFVIVLPVMPRRGPNVRCAWHDIGPHGKPA